MQHPVIDGNPLQDQLDGPEPLGRVLYQPRQVHPAGYGHLHGEPLVSIAAKDAHQVTRCRIQTLRGR
jgi:hypothetical protein